MHAMLGFCYRFCAHPHRYRYRKGNDEAVVPFVSHRSTKLWRERFEER
jgi:hypothetical protein